MKTPTTLRMPIMTRSGNRPVPPRISIFTRPFWDALSDGHLITTRCRSCGRLSFPPKPVCRHCWSEEFQWQPLTPKGTLYSYSHIRVVPSAFTSDGEIVVGIVDLSDGIRLLCRLFSDQTQILPDAPVEMVATIYDDGPLFAARIIAP